MKNDFMTIFQKLKGGIFKEKQRPQKRNKYMEDILVAIVLVLIIRFFIISAYKIPSGSMEDSLLIGDFLLGGKFVYGAPIPYTDKKLPGLKKINPGDILIFKAPHDPLKDYIKRCVAVAGQTVEIKDKVLTVDGVPFPNPPFSKYEDPQIYSVGQSQRDNYGPVRIPKAGDTLMLNRNDTSFVGNIPFEYWALLIHQENNRLISNDPFVFLSKLLNPIFRLNKKENKVEVNKAIYIDSALNNNIRRPVNHPDLLRLDHQLRLFKQQYPNRSVRVENSLYYNGEYLERYVVKHDNYFMMGDNRDNSQDSRWWGFLNENLVIAKPIIIYWSWESERDYYATSSAVNPLAIVLSLIREVGGNIFNGGLIINPRWSRVLKII